MRIEVTCTIDVPTNERASWLEGFLAGHIAYAFSDRYNVSPDDVRVSNIHVMEVSSSIYEYDNENENIEVS